MTAYHFIGIKGSGMSALAALLHDQGHFVTGSDVGTYYFTQQQLEEKGIPLSAFSAESGEKEAVFIAGNAFADSHAEIEAARKNGKTVRRYHEFLGELLGGFKSIAVSGAHGKTTTTGLLAHVMGQLAPTSYLIGDGTGKGMEKSEYLAFEACEYKRHFLAYRPDYAIITNIDFDHPDYFASLDDVTSAFRAFAQQVRKQLVVCGDSIKAGALGSAVPMLRYGLEEGNDLRAENVRVTKSGTAFAVHWQGQCLGDVHIPLFGTHQVQNALAVIGVCLLEGKAFSSVTAHLATFGGVKRRFCEEEAGGNILVDDYAHHPTEIKATIETAKLKYPDKTCVAIFQPHTFTRTAQFMDEFAESLREADQVYLCDIFGSAREQRGTVRIEDLAALIPRSAVLTETTLEVLNQHQNAVLLFMGAGDIQKYLDQHRLSLSC